MRRITIPLAVVAIALGSGAGWAQITGSAHDFSSTGPGGGLFTSNGEICLPCHAPHNGDNTSTYYPAPLWNHQLTGQSFTRKGNSITLTGASVACMGCHDGVTAVGSFNIQDTTSPTKPVFNSALAGLPIQSLSWVISTQSFTTVSGKTEILVDLTTDLSATHPVGIAYPNLTGSATSSFQPETTGSHGRVGVGPNAELPFEDTGVAPSGPTTGVLTNVGCTTCHDPHLTVNGKFLRISNVSSALCLTCHIK